LQSDFYFQALRHALETNSKLLTHLRVEYVNQPDGSWLRQDDNIDNDDANSGDQGAYYRNFFAREGLGLKRSIATSEVIFPALNSLSLGFIPLQNAEKTLVHALNISGLSHLTLRQCPGMEDFLRAIAASGQMLRLLSLEYACGLDDEIDVCRALEGIFGIATDLTDLFLSLPGPTHTLEIWRALAHNRLPITRLVYHQRFVKVDDDSDDDSSRFEEEEDLNDLSLLPEDMDELETAGEQHPFAQLNLACLGLSGDYFTVVWQTQTFFSASEALLTFGLEEDCDVPQCYQVTEAPTHQKVRLGHGWEYREQGKDVRVSRSDVELGGRE
jgi:hypothetical protein